MESTFHPFSRLPAELRLNIWEFSLQPRIVTWDNPRRLDRYRWPRFEFKNIIPTLLHINQESRTFARFRYRDFQKGIHYYFNADLDTLFTSTPSFITLLASPPFPRVKYIVLNHHEFDLHRTETAHYGAFKKFLTKSVRTPTIITVIAEGPPAERALFSDPLYGHLKASYLNDVRRRDREWGELQTSLRELEEALVKDGVPKERVPKFECIRSVACGDDPAVGVMDTLKCYIRG
ncbi:hypothetical protein EG329_010725 [Mollisiaceae sp. DMI_Dod_QoI]|nr:hypothetical protein EG329_010725 [Helotiales sp. DMI_Dod_QoI]